MTRYTTLALVTASAALVGGVNAAPVTWEALPTAITSASDVINTGTAATNVTFTRDTFPSGTSATFAASGAVNYGADVTINGIDFTGASGSGPFGTSTGDTNLDTLVLNHAAFGNATDPWVLAITGLVENTDYMIQIFGINDTRGGGISARTTTYQDTDGGLVSPTLVRATGGSVIGTFTTGAGETSLTINAIGAADPGAAGAVIRVVPEPGSLALLGIGGLLIARRRRA